MKPRSGRVRTVPPAMGRTTRWLIACGCAATLAACNTMPERDAQLEGARIAHDAARDNAAVQTLAPVEYRRADDEYRRAEAAWQHHDSRETVDHLAYLAQRRAEIAMETANLRASEAVIANAKAERDRIELEARTRDANIAQRQARVAEMQAEETRQQALVATRAAQLAEQQAMASRSEALAASQRATESATLAQSLAVQLADLQTRLTNRGMVVTLGDVLFETGSARLREPGMRAVDRLATFMRDHPERTVAVEGFTDNLGSEVFNQELSERRAATIRDALITAGVAQDRISVRGYGKAYPIASNGDATGRQMNRRVEVVISDPDGRIPPRG
jgi:outer membrane protein OmpA-like peptidoglycan-associated protein